MVAPIIEETLSILKMSNRGLASLMGMDPHTLIENKKKQWDDLTPKTRSKFFVVCSLVNIEFRLIRPDAIVEILNEHVFENDEGFKDSVLSAIESDKFSDEAILNIGKLAYKVHLEKELKKSAKLRAYELKSKLLYRR